MFALATKTFGLALALSATPALAASVTLKDPKGDDNGPGSYTYPSKSEYVKGSFDLTEVKIKESGGNIEITVEVAAKVEDPWESKKWGGNGFSLQMFQLYIDTDGKAGSGEKDALPGMNAEFADDSRWERVVVISAQGNAKVQSEVDAKAKSVASKVVLPKSVKVSGKEITATVAKKDLGGIDLKKVGYQILVGSTEGYPKDNDILSRRVNEFEGEHRFGGGDDGMADPHFVDVLAGSGKGEKDEVAAQHAMLKYDASANKKAVLKMVRP